MSRAHAESAIKATVGKVVKECAVRGHAVSDTLAAFVVKAVVLDPTNGLNTDRIVAGQDVLKLQSLCVDKLTEKCSPSLDTIKMQVYFDVNHTPRCDSLEEIRRMVESRLSTVSREITDSRAKTKGELEALYCKIICYILLRSRMGSATDVNTVQEAKAALQSVFSQADLGPFMVLLRTEKEQQLKDLTMIVTGIRLFNNASQKEEEEADLHHLIPTVLTEALLVTSGSIAKELSASQSLAWKYTAVLEKLTDPGSRDGMCDVSTVLIKQALYNVRQHEAFLKMLQADACLCARQVERLQGELFSQMKLLKEAVKSKRAVQTAQVFPMFRGLSNVWSGLQDEAELLNTLTNTRLNLQPFIVSQANIFPEAYLDSLLEPSDIKTDEQRVMESSDEPLVPADMKTQEWLLPEAIAGFSELLLQYSGTCGYTLVDRNGLLLPGNPRIGVLKHKEKLYAFSSKEAGLKFASSPDDFILKVAEKAKFCPELIHLLKIHQEFSCISPFCEPGESLRIQPIIKCEGGTQTDVHPVETNMVKTHEWNEWELRRKALKWADLSNKVTRSTQTDRSHMRRENVTQTWLLKNSVCQTTREGETMCPTRPGVPEGDDC